jgi:hypothetical protein
MDLTDSLTVDLNISTWTARKMDKKVSEEIDASKGTTSRAGNYHKHLLAGTQKLEEIQKLVGEIRTWHYQNTVPWSDGGSRLLTMGIYFDYVQQLHAYETQFNQMVDEFFRDYPQLVSASAFTLGSLFDRSEYPEVEDIKRKFKFRYMFNPLPTSDQFERFKAGDAVKEQLAKQYEEHFQNKLNDAMKDLWTRLHDTLSHMSTKLADAPEPRKMKDGEEKRAQIFRDSLITNAFDLCGLLTKLNVTQDPKLEEARKKLESAISGITPKEVRENDDVRQDVKARVDEILSAFNF